MNFKFITSFLTLFTLVTPINNIIYSSQSSSFDKSDVVADLESDSSFTFEDYKKNEDVKDEDAIKDITLVNSSNSLYLYLFNQNGKLLESNLKNVRASISFVQDYTDTSYYLGSLVSKSDDNLFYKFRFDYSLSNIEQVHFADIEFDYGEGYALGRHNTLASSYFFEENNVNPYLKKELNVINLCPMLGSYRFNTINANGCYTDMFYITFYLKDNLGDLVGIKLTWKEDHTDIYNKVDYSNPLYSYSYDNSYTSDLIVMDYSNKDLLNIQSLGTMGSSFSKFIFNLNPKYWFTDKSTDYENIPVIEKITYDHGVNSKFDGYYFSEDTIKLLNEQFLYLKTSNSSNYVIRFSLADFIKENNFFVGYSSNKLIKTEILDCDVLTLTFCKDSKTYSLMASSKPGNYDPGNEIPKNNIPDWLTRLKQFLSVILLIVLICVSFPIIVNIIIPICKLIFKVISLPFKAISKAVKKKKNKNKKE